MTLRRLALLTLLIAAVARAENIPPRDIWSQAASAGTSGNLPTAIQKTNELFATGRAYGIQTYPAYAFSATALAREADRQKRKDIADWAAKAAQQLDPRSPAVAFSLADRQRDLGRWPDAVKLTLTALSKVFGDRRTRILAQSDLLITAGAALVFVAGFFAIALLVKYGRAAAHDFRELVGTKFHGGAVSVLAVALIFLPLFLWLGPIWLILYWLVIFFGYSDAIERVIVGLLLIAIAIVPVLIDRAGALIAGVDNPIVQAAMLSTEQSYRPEGLQRLQEVGAIVSDNDLIHILLGNLHLQEGNEAQAQVHYSRAAQIKDSAGAHVNLGNLHFLNGDHQAAKTEYEKAQELDPRLAIAFYNDSLASGELYRFDEQGKKLEQAKKLNRGQIERLTQNPPPQKIVIYTPPMEQAWTTAEALAKRKTAQAIFGTYAFFDLARSIQNPVTIGAIAALLIAVGLWLFRRKKGYANACIKCGRTFCHRCKSARESATYCTQCIHIYLKKDGVALETKRRKVEEVQNHQTGMVRRNKILATLLPGTAQVVEGSVIAGLLGTIAFVAFVATAILVGRLAPAIGPVAEASKLILRSTTGALAFITWLVFWIPVMRRKAAG